MAVRQTASVDDIMHDFEQVAMQQSAWEYHPCMSQFSYITDQVVHICCWLQAARKVNDMYVGGRCVKNAGGVSGLGVFLWVLCSTLTTVAAGAAVLWLQQAGFLTELTWDNLKRKVTRSDNALNEGLYHELSMDTGF